MRNMKESCSEEHVQYLKVVLRCGSRAAAIRCCTGKAYDCAKPAQPKTQKLCDMSSCLVAIVSALKSLRYAPCQCEPGLAPGCLPPPQSTGSCVSDHLRTTCYTHWRRRRGRGQGRRAVAGRCATVVEAFACSLCQQSPSKVAGRKGHRQCKVAGIVCCGLLKVC